MTVASLKQMLGIPATDSLPLFKDENKPEWLSFFQNSSRTQICVHADTLAKIKAGEDFFLKTANKVAKESGEPFVQHVLCISTRVPDATL